MNNLPGAIVCSVAGHDKGKYFCVLALKDGYAYLADGKSRKADTPKKKKQKHLNFTGAYDEVISAKLLNNEKVTNKEIRYSLSNYKMSHETDKNKL